MTEPDKPDVNSFQEGGQDPPIDEDLIGIVKSLPDSPALTDSLLTMVPQAQQIKTYLEEIARLPRLSDAEQSRLLRRIKEEHDGQARKKLNEANMSLVVWIAKEYAGADLLFSDLITDGTIGLINAIDTYDLSCRHPFALYAAARIRQSVSQAVAYETSQNRVPAYLLEKVTSIKPISQRLTERIGREPTREEVADELGMSTEELDRLVQLVKQAPTSEEASD